MKQKQLRQLLSFVLLLLVTSSYAQWVVPSGEVTPWTAKIVTGNAEATEPADDANGKHWYEEGYDDSLWGSIVGPMSTENGNYEEYSHNWLRYTFTIDDVSELNNYLTAYVKSDDASTMYINGQRIMDGTYAGLYLCIELSVLHSGENTIAIYAEDGGGFAYLDFAIKKPIECNGVVYEVNVNENTAFVLNHTPNIGTDVVILSEITFDGETYPVVKIGEKAFLDCVSLRSVSLPNTLKEIGAYAFQNCTNLENIVLPDGLETVYAFAFAEVSKVASLNIPASVTYFDCACCDVGEIVVDKNNPIYSSIGKSLFNKDKTILRGVLASYIGEYVIPNNVVEVAGGAFRDCDNITGVVIPSNVTTIGASAFTGCNSLETLYIPETVVNLNTEALCANCRNLIQVSVPATITSINDQAFRGCHKLQSIDIPEGVTSIGAFAFEGCNEMESIMLPSTLEWIDYYGLWYCEGLQNVTCKALTPPMLGQVGFCYPGATLYVPSESRELYRAAECWRDFGNIKGIVASSTDVTTLPNTLYFNDVENRAGDFNLALNMKCVEENITAFQCDIYLPEGVTWKNTTDKRGNVVYDLPVFNEDRTDISYHTINPIAKNSDGSYKIIVYSMQKDNILETDGALLYLPLQISEEMESGEYNISVKNIVLTDIHTQQTLVDEVVSKLTIPSYEIGDANGDDMINVTDIVSIISYILGEADSNFIFDAADVNGDETINVTDIVGVIDIILNANPDIAPAMISKAIAKVAPKGSGNNLQIIPFTVLEGTTAATAKLDMNNPGDEFTAFQCEVEFPEGISWATTVDKRGNVKYTAPTFDAEADRTDSSYHTVEIGKNASGNINIFVYSMQKEIILDEEGAVLDLPFVVDENLAPGIYDVKIKNVVMTRTDQSDVKPADYTFSILVGSPAEPAIALNGNFTDEAIAEYNTALAANSAVAAIDLSNAVNVSNNTAFTTGNKNLVLYVDENASVKNTNNVVIGDECQNLVLTDGYSFAAPKAFTAANASYSRSMGTTWGTICLPYAVTSDENVAYYGITGVENDMLTLTKYDELPAGTPALVKKLAGEGIAPQATSVAVSSDINNVAGGVNMYGSYTNNVRVENPNSYYIYNDKFYSCNEYFFCNDFRAYFTMEGAGAKVLHIADIDDVATAIDALTGAGNGVSVEAIYGENGVLRNDLEKGVNIVKLSNGKTQKIVIK